LKTDKILKSFKIKGERKIVLRTPKFEDVDDLMELINSLVDEEAEILITKRVSKQVETEFLKDVLSRLAKRRALIFGC
jgi:hypothetical protein